MGVDIEHISGGDGKLVEHCFMLKYWNTLVGIVVSPNGYSLHAEHTHFIVRIISVLCLVQGR